MYYTNHKKGYTLLFSIIVSSIVLSIAAFILMVSRKQFILSSAARDSTVAIYAADSGVQCAVQAFFNLELASSSRNGAAISCNGQPQLSSFVLVSTPPADMNFANDGATYKVYQTSQPLKFYFPPGVAGASTNTCAMITVFDGYDEDTFSHKVIIDSRGYNISNSGPCDITGNPINPRAVERAIRIIYQD